MAKPLHELYATEAAQRLRYLAGPQGPDLPEAEREALDEARAVCEALRQGQRG